MSTDPSLNKNQRMPPLTYPGKYPFVRQYNFRDGSFWRQDETPNNETYARGHISGAFYEHTPVGDHKNLSTAKGYTYNTQGLTGTVDMSQHHKVGSSFVHQTGESHYTEQANDRIHAAGVDGIHLVGGLLYHHGTRGIEHSTTGSHVSDVNDGDHHHNVHGDHVHYVGGSHYTYVGGEHGKMTMGNFDHYISKSSQMLTIGTANLTTSTGNINMTAYNANVNISSNNANVYVLANLGYIVMIAEGFSFQTTDPSLITLDTTGLLFTAANGSNVAVTANGVIVGQTTVNSSSVSVESGNVMVNSTGFFIGGVPIGPNTYIGNTYVSNNIYIGPDVFINTSGFFIATGSRDEHDDEILYISIEPDGITANTITSGNITSNDTIVTNNFNSNNIVTTTLVTGSLIVGTNATVGEIIDNSIVSQSVNTVSLTANTILSNNLLIVNTVTIGSQLTVNNINANTISTNTISAIVSFSIGPNVTLTNTTLTTGTTTVNTTGISVNSGNVLINSTGFFVGGVPVGANTFIGNVTIIGALDIGTNVVINTTTLSIGANLIVNNNGLYIGNTSVNSTFINVQNQLITNSLAIGANLVVNTSGFYIGNNSVNSTFFNGTANNALALGGLYANNYANNYTPIISGAITIGIPGANNNYIYINTSVITVSSNSSSVTINSSAFSAPFSGSIDGGHF